VLVRAWHSSLLRVAQIFVPTRALAEEVVQETWLRVLGALERFEERSSLKTWVFRILVNTAKTRAQREGRAIPFSSLHDPARVPEAALDPARFLPDGHDRHPGGWFSPPAALPEERLIAAETREVIAKAIEALPASQRAVISLRDVEGWSSDEVRNALDLVGSQSTCVTAPCAVEGAAVAGGVPRMIDVEAFSCQELVELVTDYLEGALSPADLRRFEEHVAICGGCAEYVVQFRRTLELTGTVAPHDLTPETEAVLLDVFRSWRGQQPGVTAPDR